jgi:hypothetical protein
MGERKPDNTEEHWGGERKMKRCGELDPDKTLCTMHRIFYAF